MDPRRLIQCLSVCLFALASCRAPLSEEDAAAHPLARHSPRPSQTTRSRRPKATEYVKIANQTTVPRPRELAKRLLRSTFVVLVTDESGTVTSLGSAVALLEDVLLTNAHVVEDHFGIRVQPVDRPNLEFEVESTITDGVRDLALLKVPGLDATGVEIAYRGADIGDKIYVAGNPDGLSGSFSDGLVSAFRDFDGCRLFQMTAPIAPGSSGGPVVNETCGLVGVSVGVRGRGENLNFAIHLREILEFLQESGYSHPAMAPK